jgi:hypothetical protein
MPTAESTAKATAPSRMEPSAPRRSSRTGIQVVMRCSPSWRADTSNHDDKLS